MTTNCKREGKRRAGKGYNWCALTRRYEENIASKSGRRRKLIALAIIRFVGGQAIGLCGNAFAQVLLLSKSERPDQGPHYAEWRASRRFGNDGILSRGAREPVVLGLGMSELLVKVGADLEQSIALVRETDRPQNRAKDSFSADF